MMMCRLSSSRRKDMTMVEKLSESALGEVSGGQDGQFPPYPKYPVGQTVFYQDTTCEVKNAHTQDDKWVYNIQTVFDPIIEYDNVPESELSA